MTRDPDTPANAPAVLLVCLGNICRSPLAELALRQAADAAHLCLIVDSAGTGDWHVGAAPDRRARAEAARHGLSIDAYRARQVTAADFDRFDAIIALDEQNLVDLRAIAPVGSTAELALLLDFVPGREGEGVFDPYHGDAAAFAETWADVCAGAAGIVARYRSA